MAESVEMYSVNLWESTPYTNDDCLTGDDFLTLEEANEVFENPDKHFFNHSFGDQLHVEIKGPGINRVRVIGTKGKRRDRDAEGEREIAMQNGMAFGVAGYNDTFGY